MMSASLSKNKFLSSLCKLWCMKRLFFLFLLFPVFARAQTITSVAGNGIAGYSGDGGLAVDAQLNNPSDVFKDASGNIFIADKGNHVIRKISPFGIITTIAGNGIATWAGDGGPASSASLNLPNRVFADNSGNIFIADVGNNVIRKINTSGIISTIAGTGIQGFSGDGGPAINATLSTPTGVAADNAGNIYISDQGNSRIRLINPTGIISTYAGGGPVQFSNDGAPATSVSLCGQNYISLDNAGTIYITNHDCWHFLKVTPDGLIYNVAGNSSASYSGDGGPAATANIEGPYGISPDNMGNVYLCAQQNERIRKVNPMKIISTLAGTGVSGYSGDGGPASNAQVSSTISGIYADTYGNVYFADAGNNRVRVVSDAVVINGESVTLYPNPAGNKLVITAGYQITSVCIYNLLGQTFFNLRVNAVQQQIDLSALPAGIYLARINGSVVRKFVKL